MNPQPELMFPEEQLIEYDAQNPHIYEAFKKLAFRAIDRKYKNWSTNGIFEVLRWESNITGNDEWKINNNYRAYYARKFAKDFPQHKDFFRTRKSKFDES